MNKTTGWIAAAAAFVVLLAIVFFATRHSQKTDASATNNVTGVGTAYDATTGNTVPANAAPGTPGTPPSPSVSPVTVTPSSSGAGS